MNDARIDALERTVNILCNRLASLEAEVSRLGQQQWQMVPLPSTGGGGGAVKYAVGAVPAKAGGVLGSATVSLFDLSAGALVAAGSATAWNDGAHATAADLVVMQDASGNWLVIAEFCP